MTPLRCPVCRRTDEHWDRIGEAPVVEGGEGRALIYKHRHRNCRAWAVVIVSATVVDYASARK